MSKEQRVQIKELSTQAIDGLLSTLVSVTDDAKASDTMKRFLAMQGKQYKYSWRNLALILSQNNDATFVASYTKWQEIFKAAGVTDAYIEKGSAIQITVPMYKKITDEKTGEERRISFFGSGNVFDVSSVKNFDLTQMDQYNQESEDMTALYYHAIEQYSKHEAIRNIRVSDDLNPACGGYAKFVDQNEKTTISEIVLNGSRNDSDKLRVLFHEAAHALLHMSKEFKEEAKDHHRTIAELEAESIAFVCATHIGLDSSDSGFYLAAWKGDKKEAEASLKRISETSKVLIDLLKGE